LAIKLGQEADSPLSISAAPKRTVRIRPVSALRLSAYPGRLEQAAGGRNADCILTDTEPVDGNNGWKADIALFDQIMRLPATEVASVEIHVRAAEPDDADAVDQLILYLDQFHAEARPDLFYAPSQKPRGDHFLQTALDDPKQQILVAMRNSEAVGYVHVIIRHSAAGSPRVERQFSEIDTIVVHPLAQRLGTGGKLIAAALAWAEANGVHDHQVAVHEFNRSARKLYERLGFAPSVTVLRQKR